VASPSPPDLTRLRADVDAARDLMSSGRPQAALRRLRLLRRRLDVPGGDPAPRRELLARVLLSQASAQFEVTGRLDEALALLTVAEELAEEASVRDVTATVRGQRGLLLLRAGRTGEALRALDEAEGLLELTSASDQAKVLLNRSALHLEHGSLAAAEADLRRCLAITAESGDQGRYWAARHNLGYVHFLAGRLPKALQAIEEAIEHDSPPHPVNLLDQARVLREAGLVRDADAILGRASQMFAAARLQQDLAETEVVRAECALVEQDPARARAYAASAYRRFARRGNLRWQRRAELLALRAARAAADSKGSRARRTALRAVAAGAEDLAAACGAEARPDLARAATLLAAECRLRAGDEVAGTFTVRATDSLQTRLHTREVRALAACHRGDPGRARREVRRGLDELGDYQTGFGSLDLRTASAVHGVALARLGLEIAVESGRAGAVLEHVERARAVSTRLPRVRPPSDDRTAELLAELRQVEEEARGLAGDPTAVDQLSRLRSRAAQLQRGVRSRAWELEGELGGPRRATVSVAELREATRGGQTLVSFARHQDRWVAVAVRGRVSRLTPLAEARMVDDLVSRVRGDLDVLAMPRVPEALQDVARRSLGAGLRRLDEVLLGPLGVGDGALVASCSGALAVLPWGLLPSRVGRATVVTPSASAWLRARRAAARPDAPRVVAVAGPDLRRADDEATGVARLWSGATVRLGSDATVAAARADLARSDVFHVAGHGLHRQDSPLFSSLRLADGQLYAYELDADTHVASCVVLSACEAGLATIRPGDEGLGLTNVLLHLGARSVLAGVARVRDDVAADVMHRVHRDMAAGVDSADALARAQAASGDAGAPAPFVAFGAAW
jgi:hypothetical protein